MKLGSGHKTPIPIIEAKAAPIEIAFFKVVPKRSVGSSFLALTSVFWALPASSLGGLGFGHNNSPFSVTTAPLATSS